MDINWKEFSKSPGYISLKKAYIEDIKKGWRNKKESYKHFQWVINRAKHYSNYIGTSIESVLNIWEVNRDYWWLSYYQETKQYKFHSHSLKKMEIKGIRKHFKKIYRNGPKRRAKRMVKYIQNIQKSKSTKIKPRWSNERKRRMKRMRKRGL